MTNNRRGTAAAAEHDVTTDEANAKALAVASSTAVAVPEDVIDFTADAGAGMEHAGAEAFAIPFLKVLQTNSPEVDETHAKYVKDAKAGMIYNTVTGELFDGREGVEFVPCHYQRRFLRWAPRGSGQSSSFKGDMDPGEVAHLRDDGKLVEHEGRLYFPLPDGKVDDKRCDRVSETRSHFGLTLGKDGMPAQVLLSLASTQIKKSKLLMSKMGQQLIQTPKGMQEKPHFANVFRVTTVKESNDKGSWFGVQFFREGDVKSRAVYDMGKKFYESVKGGEVKVNYAEAAAAEEEATGNADNKAF